MYCQYIGVSLARGGICVLSLPCWDLVRLELAQQILCLLSESLWVCMCKLLCFLLETLSLWLSTVSVITLFPFFINNGPCVLGEGVWYAYTFENVLWFGFWLSGCYAISCGNFQRSKSTLSLSVPPLCDILYSLPHACFSWIHVKRIAKWMTISSLSVAVTKHSSQGNLHQKKINWIAVSEG